MDLVVEKIRNAVVALSAGIHDEAEHSLRAIDSASLAEAFDAGYKLIWGRGGLAAGFKPPMSGKRRTAARPADVRATFTRDCYTCRYCQRPTVSLDVLQLLSRAFPDSFPYDPSWRRDKCHIVYWIYSTSLEHRVPFTSGGTSAAGNLVTACYACNHIKNYLPIEHLGWRVFEEPPDTNWAGLTEYLQRLRSAITLLMR